MATQLAQVRVLPIERGQHLVICDRCDLHTIRPSRPEADELAVRHQRDHVGGNAFTQHAGLGGR